MAAANLSSSQVVPVCQHNQGSGRKFNKIFKVFQCLFVRVHLDLSATNTDTMNYALYREYLSLPVTKVLTLKVLYF